ncbi:hypothetical protein EI171_45245 [Bradyrhizobium sp. LCT2]|nr:hypothetical protein EI171_45245 [Bradyrhizobium sp. LCT2]
MVRAGLAETPPHPESALRAHSGLSPQAGRGEVAPRTREPRYAVLIQTAFTLRYSSTCCLPDSRP